MMTLAPEVLTLMLRETNARMGFWIDGLSGSPASEQPYAIRPQQINGLLSELMRAGEWLRAMPDHSDPELAEQIRLYRGHVERLRDVLPLVHETLLCERARLEHQRARIESAAEWARRSHQTLELSDFLISGS